MFYSADNICPSATFHDPARNKCYTVYTREVTWTEAADICAQNGFLTDLRTEDDYDFIISIIRNQ